MHLRCVCVLLLVGVNVTWAGLTQDFNQVFYLGFDRYNGDRVYDDSLHNNNATLKSAFLDNTRQLWHVRQGVLWGNYSYRWS